MLRHTKLLVASLLIGILPADASGSLSAYGDEKDCSGATAWDMDAAPPGLLDVQTPTDSVLITNSSAGTTVSLDVTADVQDFLDDNETNLGWLLTKTVENEDGRVAFDARTTSNPPVLMLDVQEVTVPIPPPDSLPSWVDADSTMLLDADSLDHLSREVVIVYFLPTATSADRQAALDSISGTLIGGRPSRITGGEGAYFVQIPHDGTLGPVKQAVAKLRTLSQVQGALIYHHGSIGLAHVHPNDGAGWLTADWTARADSSSGDVLILLCGSVQQAVADRRGEASGVALVL